MTPKKKSLSSSNHHRAQIQLVLEYIEQNLDQKLNASRLASIASFSEFHFHRLFPAYMGESIHHYILSRRLEHAALLLKNNPKEPIIEVAIAVGFETHSAFSRAFKQHFLISPSAFRKATNRVDMAQKRPFLKTNPSKHLDLTYSFADLPTLTLQYKAAKGTRSGHFFADQQTEDEFSALSQMCGQSIWGYASVFPLQPKGLNDPEAAIWYGGLFQQQKSCAWGHHQFELTDGRWAIFQYKGSYAFLHQVWHQIYQIWVPTQDFSLRNTYPFEKYLNTPKDVSPQELLTQIWIPIE
ncbi:MAG: AraC family transcriptional regulator [Chloroflexota bacterium]